jgi:hypothetical protein
MKKSEARLYRIVFKVIPTPKHPLYWEIQCGLLHVWLFDESPHDAADRAASMVQALPYEFMDATEDKVASALIKIDDPSQMPPDYQAIIDLAGMAGVAFYLTAYETGTDEEKVRGFY